MAVLIIMIYIETGRQPRRFGSDFKTHKELDFINKTSMDHLPKPKGSWEAGYKAKDMKANIWLGAMTLAFVVTLVEVTFAIIFIIFFLFCMI